MPGLVGLVTRMPRERAEAELRRMIRSMLHEASYRSGVWMDEGLGVYVGWIARKGSFADGMPLFDETRQVALLFAGEEYSKPQTSRSANFAERATPSPRAFYLVEHQRHSRFPANLNGRFHGVRCDLRSGKTLLFNDRYGIHRLYYHQAKNAVYFAGEAKAILEVRPELRVVDNQSLGEFVSCGCVLDNRTLFQGIRVIPPASVWAFENGELSRTDTYFTASEWERQDVLEPPAYYERLREIFSAILPCYLAGDERIGMSLTGGLDSRAIMAWQRFSGGALPCYSFQGPFRESQDVLVARRVAHACGQPYSVIHVGTTFLDRFPHYAARAVYLTDGCVDVKHAPDLYANELAACIAPVRLTGNYGGEVLRRVRAFKPMPPSPDLLTPELAAQTGAAERTYRGVIDCHPLSFAVFRQAPWHHYGLLSLEQTQLSLRSPYLDNGLVETIFRAPSAVLSNNDVTFRLIADGSHTLSRLATDRGLAAHRKGVRAALSHAYQEFTFKAEYAYDYGMPHALARLDAALRPLRLERIFLGRHKFYHFRFWYRTILAKYVKEMLLDRTTQARPFWRRGAVEATVLDHLAGRRNYTLEIHKVLTLELFHRQFIDTSGRPGLYAAAAGARTNGQLVEQQCRR